MVYKVLANDGLEPEGMALFEEAGMDVDTKKRSPEELLEDIAGFDALLVRSATKVTRDVIEAGDEKLIIIGRGGVGVDNIDVDAASEYGITVKYAPHGVTNATAEHALFLMGAIARKIPQAHYQLEHGIWVKKPFKGVELTGKTLGIIGCGRIGQRLSELVRGLDMKVIGYDPIEKRDSRIEYRDIADVITTADFISIHTGGEKTIMGADEIGMMKPTAYLVNASRGVNVDPQALYDALSQRRIAGAALDTYQGEPKEEGAPFESIFRGLDNIVLTSHQGASTTEGQKETAIELADGIIGFLLRGDWTNAVNAQEDIAEEGKQIYQIFVTHEDRLGMFGEINTVLGQYGINIRESPSRKLDSKVETIYLVHQPPKEEVIAALKEVAGVYSVKCVKD